MWGTGSPRGTDGKSYRSLKLKRTAKGKEHLELWEYWRLVEKWTLKRQCVRVWTHLIWLIVGKYDRQLQDPGGPPKRGKHKLPKRILNSQEELTAWTWSFIRLKTSYLVLKTALFIILWHFRSDFCFSFSTLILGYRCLVGFFLNQRYRLTHYSGKVPRLARKKLWDGDL